MALNDEPETVLVEINLGTISDEDLVNEYFRRFPPSVEEDIQNLIVGIPTHPIDVKLLESLKAWVESLLTDKGQD